MSPQKPNRTFLLKLIGSLLSAALLIALLAWSWDDVLIALSKISLLELLAAQLLIFASRLFVVLRWHTLLRAAKIPIQFKNTVALTFTGLFASNFLPTTVGGDVVRLAGAMQKGYDRAICLASLAADRLINMTAMVIASPLGFLQVLQAAPITTQAAFLPGLWKRGWDFARQTLASLSIWGKNPLSLLVAFGFACAHIFCSFTAHYLLIHALGGEIEFWKLVGLLSLSYFMGLIPISINGYGWQELTASTLLTGIGGLNISISATVALITRLLLIFASLPGAFTLSGVLANMEKPKS